MRLDVADARVVISGAASSIGRGIVQAFAAEGARIVINDTDAPQAEIVMAEAEERGAEQVHIVVADLAMPSAVDAVVGMAQVAWGGIDVLISNTRRPPKNIAMAMNHDKWQRLVEIDLLSAISLTQAAIPSMKDGGGGSIVFIARDSGSEHMPKNIHSASDAALLALFHTTARAYGRYGIRSGIVCPCSVISDGSQTADPSDLWSFRHFDGSESHSNEALGEGISMRRLAADDIGRAVVDFCASRTAQQGFGAAEFASRHLHKADPPDRRLI